LGEPTRLIGAAIDADRGRTSHIEIDIRRWSTATETTRLLGILEQQGQDAMIEAMRKAPKVGSLRVPGQIGYDLHLAIESTSPEGVKQIQIATDRYMTPAELFNRDRTVEYPFIWIQVHLNKDGEGEGEMTLLAKLISAGGHDVVMENFPMTRPVLLKSLRSEKIK
jgi:hypothetical protein